MMRWIFCMVTMLEKIEEGSLHYLLKATRASAGGYVDTFEIRGIIEENKTELQDTIRRALN